MTAPVRLVIADDSLFVRTKLKKVLTGHGMEVVGEASTGKEALELYRAKRPDLMTLDIVMPEGDGIETLEKVLELDPAARVIMVSSLGLKEKILECVRKGAKSFVIKPFADEDLLAVISRVTAAWRKDDEMGAR